jgi:hypothetical protein
MLMGDYQRQRKTVGPIARRRRAPRLGRISVAAAILLLLLLACPVYALTRLTIQVDWRLLIAAPTTVSLLISLSFEADSSETNALETVVYASSNQASGRASSSSCTASDDCAGRTASLAGKSANGEPSQDAPVSATRPNGISSGGADATERLGPGMMPGVAAGTPPAPRRHTPRKPRTFLPSRRTSLRRGARWNSSIASGNSDWNCRSRNGSQSRLSQ